MAHKNRRVSDWIDPRRWFPPAKSADKDGLSNGGILQNARRSLSNLVIWMMLILTGAGLTIAHIGFFSTFESAVDPEENAARPIWRDGHLYSSEFITAVRRAHEEGRDLLADYAAFRSIWDEISPGAPMILKVVRPTPPGPYAKAYLRLSRRGAVPVDASSFPEMRPVLVEIRTLIVEGDGSGRGKLDSSGYEAEPAELTLDLPPAHPEPK
jgi:hypothetical protein